MVGRNQEAKIFLQKKSNMTRIAKGAPDNNFVHTTHASVFEVKRETFCNIFLNFLKFIIKFLYTH